MAPRPDAGFVDQQARRMRYLLQDRAALPREELEYLVQAVDRLRDDRLKACVAGLVGWGDDERAEVETFVAIALEVLKKTNVSKIQEAARVVYLRFLMKEMK